MKVLNIELSAEIKKLEIITFADIHYGDKHCDVELLKERINYVKDNKNVYCILNGDLLNNSTKNSIGDIYSEQKTPMEQLTDLIELFLPIKDKILVVDVGNHEFRTWKWDGIDITKLLCIQLGIEDRYCKEGCILFLRFGNSGLHNRNRKVPYVIYCTHGSGGGRKEGAKAIRLADMASIVDADIYIHSHTHLPMIMKQQFFRADVRSSTVSLVNKLFVNTAAYLNYGGYGELAEFKPSSKDNPKIILDGKSKKFTAIL